jgi:hypothetical protein
LERKLNKSIVSIRKKRTPLKITPIELWDWGYPLGVKIPFLKQ